MYCCWQLERRDTPTTRVSVCKPEEVALRVTLGLLCLCFAFVLPGVNAVSHTPTCIGCRRYGFPSSPGGRADVIGKTALEACPQARSGAPTA